jgi:hypothetical protein
MQGCTYVLGNRHVPPNGGRGKYRSNGEKYERGKNKRMKEWKKKEKLR